MTSQKTTNSPVSFEICLLDYLLSDEWKLITLLYQRWFFTDQWREMERNWYRAVLEIIDNLFFNLELLIFNCVAPLQPGKRPAGKHPNVTDTEFQNIKTHLQESNRFGYWTQGEIQEKCLSLSVVHSLHFFSLLFCNKSLSLLGTLTVLPKNILWAAMVLLLQGYREVNCWNRPQGYMQHSNSLIKAVRYFMKLKLHIKEWREDQFNRLICQCSPFMLKLIRLTVSTLWITSRSTQRRAHGNVLQRSWRRCS